MQKFPVSTTTSQQLPVDATEQPGRQKLEPMPFALPFFTFSYTCMEMRISNGQTEVQSKHLSFDGNKLNAERFVGQLPASVFEQTLFDTQRQLMEYSASMFKQLSSWLPFPMLGHHEDEQ